MAGELGKRNGILQSAVSIAPIFSGFLQAGIYNGLNGHAGMAGWRWLFGMEPLLGFQYLANCYKTVINGVISLPIAVAAYFFLPDTPGTAKPNWIFTAEVSQRMVIALQMCSPLTLVLRTSNWPRTEWPKPVASLKASHTI